MKILNETTELRQFKFTIGLIEGYDKGKHHTLQEVQKIIANWLEAQKNDGKPYFSGITFEANISYLKRVDDSLVNEPVVIYEGNISPLKYAEVSDEEVENILLDLCKIFLEELKQVRIYFSYKQKMFICEKD